MSKRLRVRPSVRALQGTLRPPGDKSISHRALIFAGLAEGRSQISGLLDSGDTRATRAAMEQLGARYMEDGDVLTAIGVGGAGLRAPTETLDMGNSGTAMRLLAGVLAAQSFDSVLSGDESLNRRPMTRVIRPLELMGARIEAAQGGRAPLRITGAKGLKGVHYDSPVASAQVKSCVLLAGLFAQGHTSLSEPRQSRDHTERMLPQFGVVFRDELSLEGGQSLLAADISVPADPSSAAFMVAAAMLVPGSDVRLRSVGLNPTRDAFFRTVEAMGGRLTLENQREEGGEPVADLRARYSPSLKGIDVPGEWIPAMIDEIPILLAVAAAAEGVTRIREAEELRVKESDRIAVMARGLGAMGLRVQEYPDGIDIWGGASHHANVQAAHDHRCAMSFAVLGLRSEGGVSIEGAEYIDTSYPGFVGDLAGLGAVLEMDKT